MFSSLLSSLRITVATMAICVGGYSCAVWAFAQTLTPDTANGSLLKNADGVIVGSSLIAQAFTQPKYFWPRPSAAKYNAQAAAGSNKSPTSPDLTARGEELVQAFGATPDNPLPADLATASGSGLDPNITEAGALYQVARIAQARGLPEAQLQKLVQDSAYAPIGMGTGPLIVNVLELNIALDKLQG